MNATDRTFLNRYPGRIRQAFWNARRSLSAQRNGVVSWLGAAPHPQGLEVHARNTKRLGVHVSRKFYIGRRGGLFMVRPNYLRYFKAAQFGKGSL